MCGTNKFGFPTRHRERDRSFMGFRTGDIVRATIPNGKFSGTYYGRIAIRQRPSFRLGKFDVNPKYVTVLHKTDGYEYRHSLAY